eukprot:scaffold48616_cov56-Cyclotella_meneghiniana.AAC.1
MTTPIDARMKIKDQRHLRSHPNSQRRGQTASAPSGIHVYAEGDGGRGLRRSGVRKGPPVKSLL